MNFSFTDINSILFLLKKENKLEDINDLEKIESLVDIILDINLKEDNTSELTHFSIEESIDLIYKFLVENYPNKAYQFINYIRSDENISINNNDSNNELNKLIYNRLKYYFKNNDLDTAITLLIKELKESNINYLSYMPLLNGIESQLEKIKKNNPIFRKIIFKYHIRELIKVLEDYSVSSKVSYLNRTPIMYIENDSDVKTPIRILHEYIHIDNYIPIYEDEKRVYNTAFNLLNEFPSIAMELHLLTWLIDNNYIKEYDYRYLLGIRLNIAMYTASELKAFIILIRTFKNKGYINKKDVIDELNRIKSNGIRTDVIDNIYYYSQKISFDMLTSKENIIYKSFSYTISTILSIVLLPKLKMDPKYRELLIEINDNLTSLEYEEVLRKLNLDYSNKDILNEIKYIYQLFCLEYNNGYKEKSK